MTTLAKLADRSTRVVALVCLCVGFVSADRLLGISQGSRSPLDTMGIAAFTWLTIFTLGYFFSAVGIWIRSGWGLIVAIGTSLVELVLAMLGDPSVRLSGLEFLLVLLVLVLAGSIFVVVQIRPLLSVHD